MPSSWSKIVWLQVEKNKGLQAIKPKSFMFLKLGYVIEKQ